MRRSGIDALVRSADPITEEAVSAWLQSPAAREARQAGGTSVEGLVLAGTPVRGRLRAMVLAAALVLTVGVAAGAAVLLGEPAPPRVQQDLRGVDAGFPADLRYNPDVEHARSVAVTANATLYYAELKDGGHCTEIVTSGVARGAICTSAVLLRSQQIEVTIPFTDPVTATSPVTIGGRVNVGGAASVEIRYGDGSTDRVSLGDDSFFLFEVPAAHLGAIHGAGFTVVARGADGNEVATTDIPAVDPEPAGPIEDPAPITVDTISDGSDLTLVLGVRGRVNAPGAASLEFAYPDGTTVTVPIDDDGGYEFDIPSDRQGDLFHAPGMLIARDAGGREVASSPVAAVAFWRAHTGG